MKVEMKMFFSIEPKKYKVVKEELYKEHDGKRMCRNCRKFIYNRLTRGQFCAYHKTPVDWFECCAYFIPIWGKKL